MWLLSVLITTSQCGGLASWQTEMVIFSKKEESDVIIEGKYLATSDALEACTQYTTRLCTKWPLWLVIATTICRQGNNGRCGVPC